MTLSYRILKSMDITIFVNLIIGRCLLKLKPGLKHIKPIKRKNFNFKRANWDALNNDLCQVEWDAILDCMEPEIAWSRFKSKLSYHVNKHIPSLTIK